MVEEQTTEKKVRRAKKLPVAIEPDELKKIQRGVFIPTPKKKKRGNPNEYFIVPQEGEPTEYNIGDKYCPNCKKIMPCKKIFIKDPLQPEDVGLKGEEVEPCWLEVCKKCNGMVEEGISVIEGELEKC